MMSQRFVCLLLVLILNSGFGFITYNQHFLIQPRQMITKRSRISMNSDLDFLRCEPLQQEDYIAFGLALCYELTEDNKLREVHIAEPLTAGTLDCIEKGCKTSYKKVLGLTCGQIFDGGCEAPTGIKMDFIQALDEGEGINLCYNVVEKSMAAARTLKRQVEAQTVAVGEIADDYNFSTENKRILNEVYTPSEKDNIKQDMSIDVYGRDEEAEIDRLANL